MSSPPAPRPSVGLDFTGRTALVTGAASGIGRATATALAAHGATVALLDRNIQQGEQLAAALNAVSPGTAHFFAADVSLPDEVERVVADVANGGETLHLLAHCAGVQSYGSVATTANNAWRETLAVDLDSAFFLSRSFLSYLAPIGGSIVFIGSTQSLVAHRNSAAYVTGKHALLGLMRSIALDFAGKSVRCNCVLPGAIDTPMIRWSASQDPHPQRVLDACGSLALMDRMGTAEEVANAVLFLLSDLASFITGTSLVVDGGQLVPCGGTAFQKTGTGAEPASARGKA